MWHFFLLLLSISIITTSIFGAHIRLSIVSLFCDFWQIMVKLVTINFLCIVFYMTYNNVILGIAYVIINFSSVSCNSSLSTSVILRYVIVIYTFEKNLNTIFLCLMVLWWYYYYHWYSLSSIFFHQKFSVYGGRFAG